MVMTPTTRGQASGPTHWRSSMAFALTGETLPGRCERGRPAARPALGGDGRRRLCVILIRVVEIRLHSLLLLDQ